MKRVPYEEMVAQFARVLEKKGFTASDAQDAAIIFAQNSLAGVFSHGLNRFPRVVSYLEKGEIAKARAIQYEANRIIYKMCSAHGNLYAVQKEILRRMYGLELGSVRAPMPGLIPEDEPIVAEAQSMIEAAIAKL
jgi:N-acetylneuraminate lyase